MKGDVGMSLHEKEGEQEDAYVVMAVPRKPVVKETRCHTSGHFLNYCYSSVTSLIAMTVPRK